MRCAPSSPGWPAHPGWDRARDGHCSTGGPVGTFSRPMWRVPVDRSEVDGQVVWSWLDYGFSILHSIAALGGRIGRDWRSDAPQAAWKIVHFLGSDGSFFHPILIPALYRLAHPDWEPDIDYHVNEFYLLEGDKFSTSRRHVIWGKDILTPQSVDGVRLYLALTRPEGRQTNFERAAY